MSAAIDRYGESMTYRAVAEALASDDDPRVAEAVRLIREATNDREEFYLVGPHYAGLRFIGIAFQAVHVIFPVFQKRNGA
jgi:hypothetical protein